MKNIFEGSSKKTLIIVGLILVIIVAALFYGLKYPDDAIKNLWCGALSSLIVALVTAGLIEVLGNSQLSKVLSHIAKHKGYIENFIDEIKIKGEYHIQEWNAIITNTTALDMACHSLNHWLEPQHKTVFFNSLRWMLENEYTVRILLPHPENNRVVNTFMSEMNLSDIIKYNLRDLKLGLGNLIENPNLIVKFLKEKDLPYMLIRTNNMVLVAPYPLCSPTENCMVITFCNDEDNLYKNYYVKDFNDIFNNSKLTETIDWSKY